MSDLKIGIVGAAGRMGRMLVKQVSETGGCVICGGTEPEGSDNIGKDINALAGLEPSGILIGDDTTKLFDEADAVIDFTAPAASVAHAKLAAKAGIVQGANMSLGVNLLAQLTRKVAAILDDEFDVEILEMHHHHKVDAPSGTALLLGKAAAAGRDVDHDSVSDRGRDGITGARKRWLSYGYFCRRERAD